jgi:uncharacterized protein (TIGR02246 family)
MLVAVACQPAAAPLSDADVAAIRDLGPQYSQATLARDVDAAVALYTDDAVILPAGAPVVVGKDAIRDYIAGEFASDAVTTEFVFTSIQTDGAGDLAFDRGTWTWTGTVPGAAEPLTSVGKYLIVVRRQPDGSWLLVEDTWNSDKSQPQTGTFASIDAHWRQWMLIQ